MSLTSQLNSITQNHIVGSIEDNIWTGNPVLEILRQRKKDQDGGTTIDQPIYYQNKTSVGVYSGYDILLTSPTESVTSISFDWAHYYVGLSLAKTDKLINSGKSKIVDLMTAEIESSTETLKAEMTDDLYDTTAGTGRVAGFPIMVGTTDNFGGISSTDIAGWAGSVDSSSTVLTIGLLANGMADVTYGDKMPTHIISNQSLEAKYFQLLEVRPEFKVQSKTGRLMFKGAEWIVDRNSNGSGSGTADNFLYMLNFDKIQFYVHPKNNFKMGEWKEPINQEVVVNRITVSCQLATSERRLHKKFTTLNPAL